MQSERDAILRLFARAKPEPKKALLNVREAAYYLGKCGKAVRKMIANGELRAVRGAGRSSWRIPTAELDRYIQRELV